MARGLPLLYFLLYIKNVYFFPFRQTHEIEEISSFPVIVSTLKCQPKKKKEKKEVRNKEKYPTMQLHTRTYLQFVYSKVELMTFLTPLLQIVMLALIAIFAIAHSGMASFRDAGERLIGERAYRVLFAGISLPLAVSTIVSFTSKVLRSTFSYVF